MWPLRPHFVQSSTGLNQSMSSEVGALGIAHIESHAEEKELASVKEHVSDNCRLLVNLERMSTQHNSLADDSVWANRKQWASGHQNMPATWQTFEHHNRLRRVAHRGKDRRHNRAVGMEELFKLKIFCKIEQVNPSSANDTPCVCCQKCAVKILVQPKTGALHSETQAHPKLKS